MKLCKDCSLARTPKVMPLLKWRNRYDFRCMHPSALVPSTLIDYVYGEPVEPRRMTCLESRNDRERCGPDGRYFEPIGFGLETTTECK